MRAGSMPAAFHHRRLAFCARRAERRRAEPRHGPRRTKRSCAQQPRCRKHNSLIARFAMQSGRYIGARRNEGKKQPFVHTDLDTEHRSQKVTAERLRFAPPGVNFANQRVAVKLHHVQLKAK